MEGLNAGLEKAVKERTRELEVALGDLTTANDELRETRDGERPKVALVPSRLIAGTVMARELPEALADFDEPVAPGITQRVALAESAIVGQAIGEYAPGSKGHEEFRELARYAVRALGGR